MKKRAEWKQKTPLDQLVATLDAMEGDIINFDLGILRKAEIVDRALRRHEELRELEPYLRGKLEWNEKPGGG